MKTTEVPTSSKLLQAIRDYELAHTVWMNNSVFTPKGIEAKRKLDEARAVYVTEMRAANPTWLIM